MAFIVGEASSHVNYFSYLYIYNAQEGDYVKYNC